MSHHDDLAHEADSIIIRLRNDLECAPDRRSTARRLSVSIRAREEIIALARDYAAEQCARIIIPAARKDGASICDDAGCDG